MSGVQQRLNLKRTPIDTWSLREQLSLASAVLRSGDQNWVTVSRLMKQFAEPGRPHDWINQKTCAAQYNLLEERFDIRRPKRGEKIEAGSSPMEMIVKKLSAERIEELEKIVSKEKDEILMLEKQTELLSSDDITEEQMQEILKQIEEEEAEEDRKEAEHNEWLAKREARIMEINKILRTTTTASKNKERTYSDQSGSEMDSADAGDSPMVTDHADQDADSMETSSSITPAVTAPAGAVSSPTSSPVLLTLLNSPSKTTTFPTSPISHYSSYKTPTTATNLLHKFSPATSSLTSTPVTTTESSKAVTKVTEDKSDDVLDDINEIIKDNLKEGEVKEEIKEEEIEITKKDSKQVEKVAVKEEEKIEIKKPVKVESDKADATKAAKAGDGAENVDPRASVHSLDGVESVPVSPHTTPAGSRSMTPTPTTTPPSTTTKSVSIVEEDRDYRAWKKSIILVWNQISQHKNANLFANAVTESDAPDYRDIVYRPMDLNSIKKNVESGHIKTTEEFERDMMLMYFNATMYNSSDHEVYKLTKDMFEDTEKILRDYKNAQLLLKENEPKSLRGKSESAETIVTRPRGRSVSGSVGDQTPVSSRQESRKRERSGSIMIEETLRSEKKRKV